MIEDREAVPPCRVIRQNGVDCDIVLTERPRFNENFNRVSVIPKEKSVFVPQAPGRPRVDRRRKSRA